MIDQNATSGVIYKITVTGYDRIYIGSSKSFKDRVYAHRWMLRKCRHHCVALGRAVRRRGFEAVSIEIIEHVGGDNLIAREQCWLDRYAGRLFNTLTDAKAPTARKKTSEEAEKSAKHHRGKVVRAETRARLSAAMRGNTNGKFTGRPFCGKGHPMIGKNLYFYRISSGQQRRACRACQAANNLRQQRRRYPAKENA